MEGLILFAYHLFMPIPEITGRGSVIQEIALSFITSPFFIWVLLIFIVNKKHWRRPVLLLLISHWFLRSIGDILNKTANMYVPLTKIDKSTAKAWYIGGAIANIFWSSGEIIGDWYLLLRTKAIINNNKKIRIVFITCILFNVAKIWSIVFYFYEIPRQVANEDKVKFQLRWWIITTTMQITSFFYDLSVMICLKQNLFNQLKFYNKEKNSFVERFKKISEFRIFFSMAATMLFLPLLIVLIICCIKTYDGNDKNIDLIISVETLRQSIININYNLMYIDQILLICYVGRNNETNKKNYRKHSLKFKKHTELSYPSFSRTDLLVSKALEHNGSMDLPTNSKNKEEPPLPISTLVANYYKPVDNFYKKSQVSNIDISQYSNQNKGQYNDHYNTQNNKPNVLFNNYGYGSYNDQNNNYYNNQNNSQINSNNNSQINGTFCTSPNRSKVSNIKTFDYDY
ncbi:hypothetical protein PIROE2DRAFT_13491 [Piromyces sp. E2]|nr:hypothetical protein PIROE2DRAFT_13491 [Piromyces sp. E2]|eukprot:OUM60674.1 hypothetical protein PIROE2DRAFT_13491 [Piromyces sp. E2]